MSEIVQAADTALRILELVALSPQPLGVTQIAETVGIAKGAAHKHLYTLSEHGFVTQDATTTRYRLGPKAWLLSRMAPSLEDVAAVAAPLMTATRDETGLAVVLSVPSPRAAFVLATLPSTQPIDIGVRPGSELALHASAQGKVFLAFGDPAQIERLRGKPLPAMTPRTITSFEVLLADIEKVRQHGYATAPEEALLGVNVVAAPVRNYESKVVASVGLIGSVQHIAPSPDPSLIRRLLELSEGVSRALGMPDLHLP
jgi:IclR family KDG regulon transcriptional repressor